jgi:hypothetical protein
MNKALKFFKRMEFIQATDFDYRAVMCTKEALYALLTPI